MTEFIPLDRFLKTYGVQAMRDQISREQMTFGQMQQHSRLQTKVMAAVSDAVFEAYFIGVSREELGELAASAARVAAASFFATEDDLRPSLWDVSLQRTPA